MTVLSLSSGQLHNYSFHSPSIFSFIEDAGEILNWHRDNIISLISRFKIESIVVKKTERTGFRGKPRDSDIFKLYLEGIMLSIAGNIGIPNKHFYKRDIKRILNIDDFDDLNYSDLLTQFGKVDELNFKPADVETIKEIVSAVLAFERLGDG